MFAMAAAAVAASMAGFLAGLLTFKRSSRWCSGCGAALRCIECPGRPAAQRIRSATGHFPGSEVRR